jgi:hypothetical protein
MKAGGKQSETSVDFQRTTWYYIPEGRTLHNHCCEKPKSHSHLFGWAFPAYALFKYGFFISRHLSCKLDACRTTNSLHTSNRRKLLGQSPSSWSKHLRPSVEPEGSLPGSQEPPSSGGIWIQSTHTCPVSWNFMLKLCFHVLLDLSPKWPLT